MELLSAVAFITVLFYSNAQSQPSVVPAACSDVEIEKDAEVALDLINKHRRDGYIFTLLRIADAYVQQVNNASIVYVTLDVLESECPVLSRKHWSSCGHRDFYPTTDFGQCKAVVSVDRFFKREKLYGYNCTVSPVPPQLFECKHCPVKITILEDTEEYTDKAQKILERYLLESNGTRYFKVDKVQKVFSAVADRTVYVVEFTIKEATCPTATPTNASECEFLPDRYARMGFCKGKVVKDTKDPDGVEVQSCEIYDVRGKCGRFPFHHHHHFHHGSGERHHHRNMSENECRFPPPHPSHRHHPHRHHPHHHDHPGRGHYHRHRHGHGSRHPPPPDHEHHDLSRLVDHHNSSQQDEKEHPDFPPPAGPRYPLPPPGGPHHLPPRNYPPPPVGPPPPPRLHRRHRPSPQWVQKHGHHHDHRYNDTSNEREEGSSEEHDSFRDHHSPHPSKVDSIYHIPILSQHDVLQAPGANFLNRPNSPHGRHKEPTLPGRHAHKKPEVQPFPEVPSGSKSCPGKPKYEPPPGLLSLYPS